MADYWRPSAALAVLSRRARMFAAIRALFADRGVLEVETPVLSRHATTDPALASLRLATADPAPTSGLYLQTSPEFPMKRLLAAGCGPIYQICKVFRDDERGRRHHPEFTLLEWYRPGFTLQALMLEVADVVRTALQRPELEVEFVRYRDLFRGALQVDPWEATPEALRAVALAVPVPGSEHLQLDRDGWLDLLMSQCLEPGLGRERLTFVHDYPPSQAALARLRQDEVPVAERFELYLQGMELANGFHELSDAAEQRRRFEQDLATRRERGQPEVPMDVELLAALAAGLPDSAGVALGLDRLLMLAVGAGHIDEVMAFPVERA
ncbi:EF-P lysine aminoacylase GenX [Thiohalocapsa marina]|uniref:EF-P lysine aminoacylase GenX n=1 Tax=Thiohalocapsa marina TaxID=424902 RepID=A0A5M8FLC9_9GAMM|nr:EF-P lysine aminoacylase EpmA [Thiohalocapsa marina]KAA6185648.1 EF-P lysine aminoacylase GenX [Thiohalocapsa marina]